MSHTLVTFHAHPDDEALLTAGSMAKATAQGHRVVLVVATQGEVGQVAEGFLAEDEHLGQRRTRELEQSARVLGVQRLELLGYRDSGHSVADAPMDAFARAELDEAASRLASILEEEDAAALTTYDRNGGYGHPDHLQVHAVGRRAAELAGIDAVLEATFNRDLLAMAVDLLPTIGVDVPEGFVPPDLSTWFLPADAITHEIDVSAHLDAKRASMEAHTSQTTSSTDTIRSLQLFLSLPDELFAMAFGTEWYVDSRFDPSVKQTDLFAAPHGDRSS
jgi:LmbE family N-acetylglucosaminyl deacetylase